MASTQTSSSPPPPPSPPQTAASSLPTWPTTVAVTSPPPAAAPPTPAALSASISYAAGPADVVVLPTPRVSTGKGGAGATDSPMLNYIYDARSSAHKHMHHNQRFGPTFETNATSMTVQVGNTATIDCKISLLQDNAVSGAPLFQCTGQSVVARCTL